MTPHRLLHAALLTLVGALFLCGCGGAREHDGDDVTLPDPGTEALGTRFVARGPHPVGFAMLEGEVQVKAWYPASEVSGDGAIDYSLQLKLPGFPADPVSILGAAHRDAPVNDTDGPWPAIVLSHGFSMNPEWYHDLAEHLASYGFLVLAPEHVESDWFVDVVGASVSRPATVSDTIDLAMTGAFADVVDPEHVAVVGHSYGGYTALASAGARFQLQDLAARCQGEEDPFVAGYFCAPFVDAGPELAELMGLDSVPDGLWPGLGDDRVDAIVPIAGDAYLFGDAGLASVQIPTMLIGGTADTGTPWDWGAGLAFDAIASEDRALLGLEGAEHFVAVASCEDMPWTATLPEEYRQYICEDPAWAKREALDTIHHFTTAFLLHVLTDDPVARAALDPSHYVDANGALRYTVLRSN